MGGAEAVFVVFVGEELGKDDGGAEGVGLAAVGGGLMELNSGLGESLAVIVVLGLPSPNGFGGKGEGFGDLGIAKALEGELDGSGLVVGEVGDGGDVRKCPRMSGI